MSSSFQSNQLKDTFPAHVSSVPSTDSGKLVISISSAGVDQTPVELTERNVTIGSADDCTVSLCNDLISPHAIRITRGRQRTFVYALCPETRLNGKTFTRDWLNEGDRINCGSYDFEVLAVDPFMTETQESDTQESDTTVPATPVQPTGIRETELRKLKEHTARLRAKLEQQRQQLLEGNHEVEADLRESLEHLRKSRERLVALTVEAQAAPEQTEVETISTPEPMATDHTSFTQKCDATTKKQADCSGSNQCDSPCEQPAIENNESAQYNLLSEEATTGTDSTEITEDDADQAECLASPFECEVVDVPAEIETNSLKEWFNADEDSTEERTALLEDLIDDEDETVDLSYETVIEIEESDCFSGEIEIAEAYEAETVNEGAEETLQPEYETELFTPEGTETVSLEPTETSDSVEDQAEPAVVAIVSEIEPDQADLAEPTQEECMSNYTGGLTELADATTENNESVETAPVDPPKSSLPQHVLDIIHVHKQEFEATCPQESAQEIEASEEPAPVSTLIEADSFTETATETVEDSSAQHDVTDAAQDCEKETDDQEVERLLQEVIREHETSRSEKDDKEECAGETFFSHIESEADEAEARLNQRMQLPTFTSIRDGLSNLFSNSSTDTHAESEELSMEAASQNVASDEFPEVKLLPEVSPLSNETVPVEQVANEEPASFEEQVLHTEDLVLEQVLEQPETLDCLLTQEIPEQDNVESDRVEQITNEQRGSHMDELQLQTSKSENVEAVVATDAADAADAAEPNDQAEVEQVRSDPQSLTYEQIKESMMDDYDKDSELLGSAIETESSSTTQMTMELQESEEATSTTGNDAVEEQEESVEAYMERLLNRTAVSKSSAQPKPANPAPTKTEQRVEVEVKSVLKETFSEQLANRQEVLKPVEISPQSLPQLETNYLDEMRNMSRESAKSAIEESFRRKTSTTATVQLGLACCCLLGGLIQTVLAKGFTTTAALMAIPFYIAAAVLFYLYNNWRRSCHKVGGQGAIESKSTDNKDESGETEK